MKNPNELNDAQALLDAVLGDPGWQEWNSSLRQRSAVKVSATRRMRRIRLHLAQAAGAALALGAVWWAPWTQTRTQMATAINSAPTLIAPDPQFISEQQMLTLFPAGSCVIAEVNGQKELVFFDAQKAAAGFELSKTQ
jgi:hypothetical protein